MWGRAALAQLVDDEPEAVLDDAKAYLDGPNVDQQVALWRHHNAAVAPHLLSERLLSGLPRPMTQSSTRAWKRPEL